MRLDYSQRWENKTGDEIEMLFEKKRPGISWGKKIYKELDILLTQARLGFFDIK